MEKQNIQYKDLQCILVEENSKKYLVIEELQEGMKSKAKEYGFVKQDNVWKLEVYNCYSDYQIDEEYNICNGQSVGKYILSDTEIIYVFQQEMHYSRFWQITYEEYINYKAWENDSDFIKKITTSRPYLGTYFSRNDLFKIILVNRDEYGECRDYCLEYLQMPTVILEVNVLGTKTKEKPLRFRQTEMRNFAKVDIDKEEGGLPYGFYNGYICLCCTTRDMIDFGVEFDDYAFYKWNKYKRDEKIVEFTLPKKCSIEEIRNAIKSAILKIDKIDLVDATNKVIALAQEYINDNIYTEFMNTLIKNYTLAEGELEIVTGGCRAYSYSCPYIGDNREKELLKTMDEAEQIYQRLLDNRKKYNIQQNADEKQHINKDDFLNSYYNKD